MSRHVLDGYCYSLLKCPLPTTHDYTQYVAYSLISPIHSFLSLVSNRPAVHSSQPTCCSFSLSFSPLAPKVLQSSLNDYISYDAKREIILHWMMIVVYDQFAGSCFSPTFLSEVKAHTSYRLFSVSCFYVWIIVSFSSSQSLLVSLSHSLRELSQHCLSLCLCLFFCAITFPCATFYL